MEFGYLNLIGSHIDLVHYILIDGVYYTLTRNNVAKTEDYHNGLDFYIEFVLDLDALTGEDKYYMNRPALTSEERTAYINSDATHKVSVELVTDQDEIDAFQALSVENDFYYFEDYENERLDIVLMKYKKLD